MADAERYWESFHGCVKKPQNKELGGIFQGELLPKMPRGFPLLKAT